VIPNDKTQGASPAAQAIQDLRDMQDVLCVKHCDQRPKLHVDGCTGLRDAIDILEAAIRPPAAQPAGAGAAQESVGPFLSPREEVDRILTERSAAPSDPALPALDPWKALEAVRKWWDEGKMSEPGGGYRLQDAMDLVVRTLDSRAALSQEGPQHG
jgi:hypothetical protein